MKCCAIHFPKNTSAWGIFLFDSEQCETFRRNGINTVYYLPLAANVDRLQAMQDQNLLEKYQSDVSFVGSLYTEPKHQLYERLTSISDYTRGYLEGLMEAQLQVYGTNFIEDALTPQILDDLLQAYPMLPSSDGVETSAYLYADYVLNRKVTATERQRILQLLGACALEKDHAAARTSETAKSSLDIKLYTHDKSCTLPGIQNCGPVDYYDTMPYVFKASKCNLNITLRSIKSGIPLRAFDILGAGGLLLTSYTSDLMEYFTPDEDFVLYESIGEIPEKIDYLLNHEDERMRIAENGLEKVRRDHTFEIRAKQMLDVVRL